MRVIIEIKKTLHKTLGRSHLSYEDFESITVYIVRNLNNHPLTYSLRLKKKKRFIKRMYHSCGGEMPIEWKTLKITRS